MNREEWDRRYQGSELLWSATPNRFLVEQVTGLPAGRALDVGTGEGRNAVWLAERRWRVTGVDFSDVALEKAQRLASARGVDVAWVAADPLDYEAEEAAYDLVVMLYLHLAKPELAVVLHRVASALVPGGTILVVGHDRTNLAEGHGGPQDPAILLTTEELAAELDGLDVHHAGRVKRSVETEEGVKEAVDTLVRAVRRQGPAS